MQQNHPWSVNFHPQKLSVVATTPVSWQVICQFQNLTMCWFVCDHFFTVSFYCFPIDSGELYTWGSNENGCLGIGYSFLLRLVTWSFPFLAVTFFFVSARSCFNSSNYVYLVPRMSFICLKKFKGHSWSLLLASFLVVGSILQPFLVSSSLWTDKREKRIATKYFFLVILM